MFAGAHVSSHPQVSGQVGSSRTCIFPQTAISTENDEKSVPSRSPQSPHSPRFATMMPVGVQPIGCPVDRLLWN